jgi:hypothetical protein
MSLVTTPGSSEATSYITVEEADEILVLTGLRTPSWAALEDSVELRFITSNMGPYTFEVDFSDKLLFQVGTGVDQEVTLTGTDRTALQVATQINNATTGINCVATLSNTIEFRMESQDDTLTVKDIANAAYTILGITLGAYEAGSVEGAKEYRLILAAQLIGHLSIRGERAYTGQALDFPRSLQTDPTKIPDAVKETQAILACLVIQPNMEQQQTYVNTIGIPESLKNAAATDVKVAGIMDVKLSTTSTSTGASTSTTVTSTATSMNDVALVYCLPAYLRMKPYITQIRGGLIHGGVHTEYTPLPAVVDVP